MLNNDTVTISVRHLVEYVFLSGSIDVRLNAIDTMHEGTKAHQRVQRTYGEQDQKEVYVKAEIMVDDLLFAVDGRCDGLLGTEPLLTVDEIKSTGGNLERITDDGYPVHWAQALFYAYMYAKEHGQEAMRVQLTYVQTETEEERRFLRVVSFAELEQYVYEIAARYAPYAQQRRRHEQARNESIRELAFPFEAYRAGQRKLAGAVYKSIEEGVRLFAKAPTGIGKTISTTYPAIKAMGSGMLQRFYYLTARTTTRAAAEDALLFMKSKGLHLQSVTITAKDKICFQEEVRCEKEHCPYADGYYDRINGAVLDILEQETVMTRSVIEAYAHKHRVCPFEFSLDLAYAADAVICDYNYIFDPRISFKRQYAEMKKRTALLVDEAHNLVDRAREMFSAELTKAPFLALQRELKGVHGEGYRTAKAINDYFIALRKNSDGAPHLVERQLPEELVARADAFASAAEQALAAGANGGGLLLDTYFTAQNFIRTAKLYDDRYVVYTELSKSDVRLKLFCLDPSQLLKQMGKGYRSHIYFSATLSPVSYYMDMLGAGENDYTLAVPSPFSKEQLKVVVKPLSTRYHDRDESKLPIAKLIMQLMGERPGNYFVFFPSYAYMNAVYETYMELMEWSVPAGAATSAEVLLQRPDMTEEERDRFLDTFQAGNGNSLIGFAVMGGVFSEGVDLAGDRLIGVIVVGVGLPQLGVERNMLKDYFNEQGKSGYDYAYVFPGMNKVLQAGGRLIRSETDRGTLVLIDDRYLQPQYQRLLPEEWKG
ncbi:helicase C-terminal domain-containing protein [Paenibacillus sp. LHD-38]|uniref:helicase C-terminal domain-containing protein n=1 Tax=Paenibacillus sp. LHD-38 TaxID=3072143 RepID=UPI00280DA972|nr:helicase C-terminal domain-containing protein [Paenibacillus sp. LHD-38]MDQ8734174.1 helicase C-terminal domain-containing protein [Paenibacillus sp. LHD-38]